MIYAYFNPKSGPKWAILMPNWWSTNYKNNLLMANNNADINISYKKNITQTTNLIGHAIQGSCLFRTPKQTQNGPFGQTPVV